MSFEIINNLESLKQLIKSHHAVLCYCSTNSCSVGEALFPKVVKMINNRFPKIHLCFVPLESNPEIAGAFQVFVEPTILVFFEGKESIRKSRNLGLNELNAAIERPYDLIFSD